mmetsp:Transcript_17939/g.44794  ORF Transcript_17939/g.44794 Transcript_17939/m.44794 type:complete len:267 (-) Transcript_17939:1953-2753(-)
MLLSHLPFSDLLSAWGPGLHLFHAHLHGRGGLHLHFRLLFLVVLVAGYLQHDAPDVLLRGLGVHQRDTFLLVFTDPAADLVRHDAALLHDDFFDINCGRQRTRRHQDPLDVRQRLPFRGDAGMQDDSRGFDDVFHVREPNAVRQQPLLASMRPRLREVAFGFLRGLVQVEDQHRALAGDSGRRVAIAVEFHLLPVSYLSGTGGGSLDLPLHARVARRARRRIEQKLLRLRAQHRLQRLNLGLVQLIAIAVVLPDFHSGRLGRPLEM